MDVMELNLSEGNLLKNIVGPYQRGEKFACGLGLIEPNDVSRIKITETEYTLPRRGQISIMRWSKYMTRWRVVNQQKDVTSEFIKPVSIEKKPKVEQAKENVFIVHGRDDKPKLELARMLEKLGFNVIILSEQPNKGRTIIEKLEQETIDIGYAFVILTPDDIGCLRNDFLRIFNKQKFPIEGKQCFFVSTITDLLRNRARQNVILELGYFVGKIGRNRVCCLYKGDVELPSDIHGVLFKKFDKSVEECYKGILEELKAAGHDIKI